MKVRLVFSLLFLAAPALIAQDTSRSIADAELPSLVTLYKQLHANPELSTQEEKSSAIMAKELTAIGAQVTQNVGKYDDPALKGYGVVGVLKNGAGPTVLVRADMDGLPIPEDTGLPYASKVTATSPEGKTVPVMHGCGHDTHMSAFVGVARALAKLKSQWSGTIVFVAQPAEEMGIGARAMLKDGLYTRFPKPDFALSFHDTASIPTGSLAVVEGYTFAGVDSVDITVRGVGGHGAYPHRAKDPIVLASEIVLALQTIASREVDPIEPVVVTVGSIHGGLKHNIIPDDVNLQLTVRTYKAEVRTQVLAAIKRITEQMATVAGIPPERAPIVKVREQEHTPATYNNPELTARLVKVWKSSLGDANVIKGVATMGGEDFSEFSLPDHSIPATNFWFGAADPAKLAEAKKTGTPVPDIHSPKFAPVPEPTIRTAIVAMTDAVLELMKKGGAATKP